MTKRQIYKNAVGGVQTDVSQFVLNTSVFLLIGIMITIDDLLEQMRPIHCGQCAYLGDEDETLLAIRCSWLPNLVHAELIERGYRHSGDMFYTTACEKCSKCVPMRIDPLQFRPSKKQRHIMNKNSDVDIVLRVPHLTEKKVDIFRRYTKFQHPDSPHEVTAESLKNSTYCVLPSSAEIQYRLENRIIGITIADIIPFRAFSSVYHFFDPEFAKRSVGTFSMLAEIGLCRHLEIPFFYPGLWVKGCRKMEYKTNFRPYQLLIDGVWVDCEC